MQNFITQPIRTAAVLTTSYVAGTELTPSNVDPIIHNQLILLVDFTIGSLTTAELKIEFSPDGTNYYQETADSVSGGTIGEAVGTRQFSATGAYRIAVPIKDHYIKVSVKGTGTVTSSSMAIKAILGEV